MLLKLYKQINDQLHYWETWDINDSTVLVHWGIVGERGTDKEVKARFPLNVMDEIQKEIEQKLSEGYEEFDQENYSVLEIEYVIDGFGTEADLSKRHQLEELMDQVLGWTGLGHSDGGSIGSGTMEVGCVVVDFEIAKKVIEEQLANTTFADYSRLFKLEY